MDEKIIIFDTTLRDGEQAPGASLNPKEKLEIALALESLGVDVVEAGFPVASPGDFAAVQTIAKHLKRSSVCGLARATTKDIDTAYQAVRAAKHPRVHVFLATSKIHMRYKLKKAEDEILRLAMKAVKYARNLCADVEFSPEDASRTEKEFLYQVVEAVIKAGAKTVNIPDTVGYSEPEEYGNLIRLLMENVPCIGKVVVSVHCHNDLGMATANSLAAVRYGARQVECTINGIGERAGNASLEEVVMGINTRKDIFGVNTSIKLNQICKTSRLVSSLTGFAVAPNKAIVGKNAFRHESGIHQDGLLKERSTYEIIRPETVGFKLETLVLGKHSGRHAFSSRLKDLGYNLSEKQIEEAFNRFKILADKKKEVFDDDLAAIIDEELRPDYVEAWRLDSFEINSGNKITPSAKIKLISKGKIVEDESIGDGPVDACYKAIEKITHLKFKLSDYNIKSITGGEDAQGEVTVRLKTKDKDIFGRASSTDIIEASIKAYLQAINKAL